MENEIISEDQNISTWKIIYPAYLDKTKSISGGRLIAIKNCIENPTVAEIAEICIQLGIPCRIERKRYPKDNQSLGRVRYKLFTKSGESYNDKILNKKSLLNYIGKNISELKSRKERANFQNSSQTSNSSSNNSGVSARNKLKKKR